MVRMNFFGTQKPVELKKKNTKESENFCRLSYEK